MCIHRALQWIKDMKLEINSFQRFNLPITVELNEARVKTRKVERTLTRYLRDKKLRKTVYSYVNRLSSYFFALSVKIEQEGGKQ